MRSNKKKYEEMEMEEMEMEEMEMEEMEMPLNFNGMEEVVGLTHWFEKMETVFHSSNCPEKYQVKYASCTLLNSALTWNEIQKMETELWNLFVKGNDLTAYTQRKELMEYAACHRELISYAMMNASSFSTMILNLGEGVADCEGYARSAENKRRLDNNLRDNMGQQPVFKRQNVGGQNVAKSYTAGNNEKKGVSHITRDCTTIVPLNTQRAPVGNQPGIVCYECGRPGHFRKDCIKLRNRNHGNKNGNKSGN
ncbi:reverse transcriptase domain-containing protein [Tanacetum coccineum]